MLKKAVVTGGAGFIGSNLVRALLKKGVETHVIDNYAAGRIEGREVEGAIYHERDILNLSSVEEVFKDAVVFHLAALPRVQDSIDHPRETAAVNVDGTLAVLEAARQGGARKLIFSSSAAVYGDQDRMPLQEDMPATPKSPYGLHKYMGEKMCALWSDLYSLPTVSLRYFNVYGPGFDAKGAYALVVGRFIDLKSQGQPLTIAGDGSNTRDYVHVSDVVRANIMAAENEAVGKGEVFNIGSGKETSVKELAHIIGGPVETSAPRIEPARSVADVSRAKDVLGWESSIDIGSGLKDLMRLHGL